METQRCLLGRVFSQFLGSCVSPGADSGPREQQLSALRAREPISLCLLPHRCCRRSVNYSALLSLQVLLEMQRDWKAVLATLLQIRVELSQTCQQLQELRQRVKEQRQKEEVNLSTQGTECRAVAREQKADPGNEEAKEHGVW